MIPWSMLWALVPRKYLIAAAALVALLLGGWAAVAHHQRALKAQYFQKGYAVAHDSAVEATIIRLAEAEALHTHRSDSLHSIAATLRDTAPLPHGPRIARIEPTDSLVPIVPLSALVKVYVESDSLRPHYADRYLADLLVYDDSVIYKNLQPRLQRALYRSKLLDSAWVAERTARNAADSAAHYWQGLYEEHRGAPVASPSHAKRNLVYATLGAAVALIARNQIHR